MPIRHSTTPCASTPARQPRPHDDRRPRETRPPAPPDPAGFTRSRNTTQPRKATISGIIDAMIEASPASTRCIATKFSPRYSAFWQMPKITTLCHCARVSRALCPRQPPARSRSGPRPRNRTASAVSGGASITIIRALVKAEDHMKEKASPIQIARTSMPAALPGSALADLTLPAPHAGATPNPFRGVPASSMSRSSQKRTAAVADHRPHPARAAAQDRVVLCMKWGTLYPADYVNVLYTAVPPEPDRRVPFSLPDRRSDRFPSRDRDTARSPTWT